MVAPSRPRVPRAPRFPIPLPLRYRLRASAPWREATAVNVSRTGLLLGPSGPLPAAGEVELVLTLPSCDDSPGARIRCAASVVRSAVDGRAALAIRRYRFLKPGEGDEGGTNDGEAACPHEASAS